MRVHYTPQYFIDPAHPITVIIVGCGGTGSQMLSGLARIHHSLQAMDHPGLFITAYDGDEVSEINIGRQLFSPSDIGLNKADVLITRINRFFGTGWLSAPRAFNSIDREDRANIYISCVDSVLSRKIIHKALKGMRGGHDQSTGYYWMDLGNSHRTGQIVLGTIETVKQPESKLTTVSDLGNVFDLLPELHKMKDKDQSPSCSIAQALGRQDLFINSTLAQLGCALLWKLLTEVRITNRGAYLNLETMNVNPIKI